ncbi:MAG: lytic transglycosylase domain-containing protein, partial [Thalassovita sp.]|nr:lytic transglycosylase domain-containing protein [Thalassovita sp.]
MTMFSRRNALFLLAAMPLAACGRRETRSTQNSEPSLYPNETPELRRLINRYAGHYEVPRSLVHRVVQRESMYRPEARNGPYYGLMQILPQTARSMGFRGQPSALLDA